MAAAENPSPSRRAEIKRVAAEEARRSKDAAVARAAREAQLDIERRREELALQREQRLIKAQEKRERKANRGKARTDRGAKVRKLTPVVGRRVMIVGPILAPMSVAWVGQIQFAVHTLGWVLVFALVFAAAWELTTAFAGWMYHQARHAGDSGVLFRAATWGFAASAGAMNYWHACPTIAGKIQLDPTPKAVSYGAMSLVGIALWELYTSLIARQELRRRGIVPEARPRFGAARWIRYPGITWRAWSLTIRYGITTTSEAWNAAVAEQARRSRVKADRAPINLTVVRGPRTRVSSRPLTTWTQPPVVWIPKAGPRVTPIAKTHPAVAAGSTPESTPEPMVRRAVRTTPETTPESTPEPTRKTTAEPMGGTTPETTSEPTDESTSESTPRTTRRTTRGRGKGRRRTRDELRVELEQKVAEHYRNGGGEIQVKPLAEELKATRKTIRELLDEMNVRPIRKASG